MSGQSGAQDDPVTLSASQSAALLGALDRAFEQVLGARFAGGVSAARIAADGQGAPQVLRPPLSGGEQLLLSYARGQMAETLLQNSARLPGLVIGHVIASGSDSTTIVHCEVIDVHDVNHRDGGMQASGVTLRRDGAGAEAGLLVLRTSEQSGDADQARGRAQRGVVPPVGRHRPRAALGLAGGTHRPALQATARRPVAGLLIGRFGQMLGEAEAIQPRLDAVTIGLLA